MPYNVAFHFESKLFGKYGPLREKTCLRGFVNIIVANQLTLISAFVICFLESIICKLATGKILIF